MTTVIPYTPDQSRIWDDFVRHSRNATFLHYRDYMDYHNDRFIDASVFLYDGKGKLTGLLPANVSEQNIFSHGGLTYGGLLIDDDANVMSVCEMFTKIQEFYASRGARNFIYKAIPTIYERYPSQEDRYALFLNNAETIASNISSSICLTSPLRYNENTRRNIRKASKEGVMVAVSNDYESFYTILARLLESKYLAKPTHTLEEMKLLAGIFPENIRLLMAFKEEVPIAGTLLYITDTVVHTQYIAANDEGKRCDALSLLFDWAIKEAMASGKRYFDFGTSNEDGGRYLNTGLIRQKNGFGGRGIVYPTYRLRL